MIEYTETYKFADLSDDEKKAEYRKVLDAYKSTFDTLDAFVRVSKRLPNY